MSERYRYGYGEDFPNRDFPSSRQGAMTNHRDEEDGRGHDVDVDERPVRADEEEAEDHQAERMREAHSPDEPRASDPGATMQFRGLSPEREQPTPAPPAPPPAEDQAAEGEVAERDADERGADERGADERAAARPEASEDDHAEHGDRAPAADADDLQAQRPASPTRRDSVFDIGEERAQQAQQAPQAERAVEPPRVAEPPRAAEPGRSTGTQPTGTQPTGPRPTGTRPTGAPPWGSPDPSALWGSPDPSGPGEERPPIALGTSAPRPADSRTSLLASIDRDSIRSRFVDIQAGFVDEPRQAVQEAERFVDELVLRLVDALEAERAKLKAAIDGGSTEDLRLALRGYRAFVDRLLNLTM